MFCVFKLPKFIIFWKFNFSKLNIIFFFSFSISVLKTKQDLILKLNLLGLVIPDVMYANEEWATMTGTKKHKISWNDKIRIEMDIFSVTDKKENRMNQRMEHMYKMAHQKLVKLAVDNKPVGRFVRRPWSDGCNKKMEQA